MLGVKQWSGIYYDAHQVIKHHGRKKVAVPLVLTGHR
jgi:hypothetical protein